MQSLKLYGLNKSTICAHSFSGLDRVPGMLYRKRASERVISVALCMCVCVCVCVRARARECISGSFCMWQVCVFVCVHACMYAWTHAHTRIHTHTHMPMNIHEGLHLVFRLEVKGLDLGACGARPDVHCARDPALEAERALLPPLAPHRSARRRR